MQKDIIGIFINESCRVPPDFEVRYRFLSPEEGGRRIGLPLQGYKCDWSYIDDNIEKIGIWMIHPEFKDADSNIIPYGENALAQGTASMYILNPKMRREVHRKRIHLGTKGFFMEGRRKVAEATVVKIIGLYQNPIRSNHLYFKSWFKRKTRRFFGNFSKLK